MVVKSIFRGIRKRVLGALRSHPSRPKKYVYRLFSEALEQRQLLSVNPIYDGTIEASSVEPAPLTLNAIGLGTFLSVEQYADWLVGKAATQWSHLFGQPSYESSWLEMPFSSVLRDDMVVATPSVSSDELVSQSGMTTQASSRTNTQVTGVDEADFVETNNDMLFAIAQQKLSVLRGFADGELEVLGQIQLDTTKQTIGMYLYGDTITVVSQQRFSSFSGHAQHRTLFEDQHRLARPQVFITVLDVSEPHAITVKAQTAIDGQFRSSRMVDGQIRLVLEHPLFLPCPHVVSSMPAHQSLDVQTSVMPNWNMPPFEPSDSTGIYESREEYVARIRNKLVASVSPQMYELDASGNTIAVAPLLEATHIDIPDNQHVTRLTTCTVLDVGGNDLSQYSSAGLFTGGAVEVYASSDHVFVFDRDSGMPRNDRPGIFLWEPPQTQVTKITISTSEVGVPSVSLSAQGTFQGTILNQFAVDDHNGYLNVVVETHGLGSGVVVMDQEGDSLTVIGSIGGLAATEDLYSVRFVGERVFFVTFERTDPLFVVDVSVPSSPTLLGELHVTGFSDHIQPLDENHLLAIGREANEQTGAFGALQVSIFDVTDLSNPLLDHRYTFAGGRHTSTTITGQRWRRGDGNHLALGFFPEDGVITIPVRTDGGFSMPMMMESPIDNSAFVMEVGIPDWIPPKQWLEVLSYDVHSGFDHRGVIDHQMVIDRAVQISGRLVAVSESEVSLHDFVEPTVVVDSIRLDQGA
ncbi:MAG: beta-propeller domain-containing protein, partial [Pirellulales bacterium]